MSASSLVASVGGGACLGVGHEVASDDRVEDDQDHEWQQEEQRDDHEEEDGGPDGECGREAHGD